MRAASLPRAFALCGLLVIVSGNAPLAADAFSSSYDVRYGELKGANPRMVRLQLSTDIEDGIASGSHAMQTPARRRVREFENALYQELQAAACTLSPPLSFIDRSVAAGAVAAAARRLDLKVAVEHQGAAAAAVVRLSEKLPPGSFCRAADFNTLAP